MLELMNHSTSNKHKNFFGESLVTKNFLKAAHLSNRQSFFVTNSILSHLQKIVCNSIHTHTHTFIDRRQKLAKFCSHTQSEWGEKIFGN